MVIVDEGNKYFYSCNNVFLVSYSFGISRARNGSRWHFERWRRVFTKLYDSLRTANVWWSAGTATAGEWIAYGHQNGRSSSTKYAEEQRQQWQSTAAVNGQIISDGIYAVP